MTFGFSKSSSPSRGATGPFQAPDGAPPRCDTYAHPLLLVSILHIIIIYQTSDVLCFVYKLTNLHRQVKAFFELCGRPQSYTSFFIALHENIQRSFLKETDKPGRRSAGLYRCFAPMKSAAESRWRTPLLLCRPVHGPKAPEKAKPIPVRV